MRWRGAQLRLGYVLYHLAHDLDLGGFPPDELGGDGVTEQGVGGYFSPFEFTNQMLRIDASWNSGERWRFAGALAGGRQKVEDIGAPDGASQTSFRASTSPGGASPRGSPSRAAWSAWTSRARSYRTRAGVDVILSF